MRKTDQPAKPARHYDLDWLRVLAVLLLVPFHSALIFNLDPRAIVYVKDQVESAFLACAAGIVHQFHMPLLFFISGASTWFALGFRTSGQYLKERITRLLVPAVFGLLVLIPPMLYVQFLWKPEYLGRYPSFFHYYPHYCQITGDLSGYSGTFSPAHLWFILYLFIFSVVALPLLLYLRQNAGEQLVSRIAVFLGKRGAIFLLVFPILLSQALPSLGGMNPFYYVTFFLFGYVAMADRRFQVAIEQHTAIALTFAVVFAGVLVVWLWPWGNQFSTFAWQSILVGFVSSLTTWCWVIALLGLGRRYLDSPGKVLDYAREAAYPFYILHLPINTIVGYFVVQWNTGIAVKYLFVNIITTAVTIAVYDVLVKRTNVTRFLFGMRLKKATRKLASIEKSQTPSRF